MRTPHPGYYCSEYEIAMKKEEEEQRRAGEIAGEQSHVEVCSWSLKVAEEALDSEASSPTHRLSQ